MFATSDSRCPVRFLERLISKRPEHLRNSGPLYLQPLSKPKPDVWYLIQPVGFNKIDGFMKRIATMGGLDITKKHFTNHSVRKTTVRKLQKAGVSNDKIISITYTSYTSGSNLHHQWKGLQCVEVSCNCRGMLVRGWSCCTSGHQQLLLVH